MKRVLYVLLALALVGCASLAAEPTATPTLPPTLTPTATATNTNTPTPTATPTPTPILTPTPPVFTEPLPLIAPDWRDVRIDRLCLDVREYYSNVGGGFSLSIASQTAQVLGLMGMEIVEVGEACDATLTFNWTLTAYSQTYTSMSGLGTSQTTATCFTGAEVKGDVRLADEERTYSAPLYEVKYPPQIISPVLAEWSDPIGSGAMSDLYATVCPEDASGAPYEELWPKLMLEQLMLLWGPPAIHAALDTGDPTLQLGALHGMHRANIRFDDHTNSVMLLHAMQSEDAVVRRVTVDYLGDSVDDDLANVGLLLALDDPDVWVRYYATQGLGESEAPTDEMAAALIEALDDPEQLVRGVAAASLGAIGPVTEAVIPALLDAAGGEDCPLAGGAARALGNIGPVDDAIAPALMEGLQAEDCASLRAGAAFGLGQLGLADEDIIQGLIGRFADEERTVRRNAAEALGTIGPEAEEAVPALLQALDDDEQRVRTEAAEALAAITGEDFGVDADAWQAWWDGQPSQ